MRPGALVALVVATACATAGAPRSSPETPDDDPLGIVAQTLLDSAASKYRRVVPAYDPARGYPHSTGLDGAWRTVPPSDWTSGFYPGTLWYLHEYTLDPILRAQAERFTLPIAAAASVTRDHDLGFQISSSFGNAYRVTGDERFHAPLLDAARLLPGSYDERLAAIEKLSDSTNEARGQAWRIYGYTVLFRETRDARFLSAARRLVSDVLPRLPDDLVPCRDHRARSCSDHTQRDAASAAIMASALLELSSFVPGDESARYRDTAEQMLASLASPPYLAPNTSAALLLHSAGDRTRADQVDVGIVYADYYFVEALLRYLQLSGQSGVRVLGTR
jgi:hypothetical protein